MSLIKLATNSRRKMGWRERVILSPSSLDNCYTGMNNRDGESFLAYNKDDKHVHFFQKDGKNSIIHYSGTRMTNGPRDAIGGTPFHGHLQKVQNRTAKETLLNKYHEFYKFKSLTSAKRFRDMLKAFD